MTHKIDNTVFISHQEDDICEVCGKVDELRPYGAFDKDKGRRLNVCFDCMMTNEPEAEKAFSQLLDGEIQ